MSQTLSLRVLQGADRGRVFHNLVPPITIGREEGNLVQLNDERVSRFHIKIQEDDGRVVVTDLDSTNGTRVNGQVCNLKILRSGDTISVGRTVLLVRKDAVPAESVDPQSELAVEATYQDPEDLKICTPNLPHGMRPGQAAELRELLDHIHAAMRQILENSFVDEKEQKVIIDQSAWEKLLSIQGDISTWIRTIEDPQTSQS
ncbi:MAG: FHA domain-containing protein [Pirellulaceae bacterium]|nr:FHA domain-containing protein [Pirellulaceae bacterium]